MQLSRNFLHSSKIQSLPTPTPYLPSQTENAKVIYVIDGDTIVINGNKKVRYIGIDTPEIKHPETSAPAQCYGDEATVKNKELVEGKEIIMKKDVSETDKYGRLLRYIWLNNGIFVNDILVKEGFARAEPIKPDTTYAGEFFESEKEAKENSRGLWKECY